MSFFKALWNILIDRIFRTRRLQKVLGSRLLNLMRKSPLTNFFEITTCVLCVEIHKWLRFFLLLLLLLPPGRW